MTMRSLIILLFLAAFFAGPLSVRADDPISAEDLAAGRARLVEEGYKETSVSCTLPSEKLVALDEATCGTGGICSPTNTAATAATCWKPADANDGLNDQVGISDANLQNNYTKTSTTCVQGTSDCNQYGMGGSCITPAGSRQGYCYVVKTPSSSNTKLVNLLSVDSLPELISAVLKAVVDIGSILLVLMLVWCGFLFVQAQGQSEKITQARTALVWTVFGGLMLLGAEALSLAIAGTISNL